MAAAVDIAEGLAIRRNYRVLCDDVFVAISVPTSVRTLRTGSMAATPDSLR